MFRCIAIIASLFLGLFSCSSWAEDAPIQPSDMPVEAFAALPSFENPKLSLGYRLGELTTDCPLGKKGQTFRAHEFHYARIIHESGESLFSVHDASGEFKGSLGIIKGSVFGSFLHII